MPTPFQPAVLTFTPVYKPYLWGGRNLPARLGRTAAPRLDRYAESWELADLPDGMSVVDSGPYAGRTLRELMREHGRALTGRADAAFPLLVKILDSADRLSVQVHPDEESAGRHGGEAKTECWFVLDAEPGAAVWAGLQPGVTPASFKTALASGTVESRLRRIPVSAGDMLFMPGGRVHAIGAGCLILEVQQRSNTTYRVFDWNRVGADGKPRPLHVEQAMRAIRWDDTGDARAMPGAARAIAGNTLRGRIDCPSFRLDEVSLRGPFEGRQLGSGFHILFASTGGLRVRGDGFERELPVHTTALIPAAVAAYSIAPVDRAATVMLIAQPSSARDVLAA